MLKKLAATICGKAMPERLGASIIDATTHQIWHGDTHSLIIDSYYDEIDQTHPLIFVVRYENQNKVDAVWGGGISIQEAEAVIEKEMRNVKFD